MFLKHGISLCTAYSMYTSVVRYLYVYRVYGTVSLCGTMYSTLYLFVHCTYKYNTPLRIEYNFGIPRCTVYRTVTMYHVYGTISPCVQCTVRYPYVYHVLNDIPLCTVYSTLSVYLPSKVLLPLCRVYSTVPWRWHYHSLYCAQYTVYRTVFHRVSCIERNPSVNHVRTVSDPCVFYA